MQLSAGEDHLIKNSKLTKLIAPPREDQWIRKISSTNMFVIRTEAKVRPKNLVEDMVISTHSKTIYYKVSLQSKFVW
jgi:hypothetical protein